MKTEIEILEKHFSYFHEDLDTTIEAMREFADQFKPKWIYTEPETEGAYLIAYEFGVTEGKFYKGKYRTSDFGELLPGAYAHMPLPTKP